METSAVTNDNITVLTVKLGRQNCLAPRSIGKRSSDIKFSVPIAVACAVLHNFCIKMGDDWDDDGNPDHHCRDDDNEDVVRDGEEIRDILKEFLKLYFVYIISFALPCLYCFSFSFSINVS